MTNTSAYSTVDLASSHPYMWGTGAFFFRNLDYWKFQPHLTQPEKDTLRERFVDICTALGYTDFKTAEGMDSLIYRRYQAKLFFPLRRIPYGPLFSPEQEGFWSWKVQEASCVALGCLEHFLWGQIYPVPPSIQNLQELRLVGEDLHLPWAMRENWGYLFSHPQLTGHGLLLRAWLNLPALSLSLNLEKAVSAIRTQGFDAFSLSAESVRGGWVVVESCGGFGQNFNDFINSWNSLLTTLFQWEQEECAQGYSNNRLEWQDKIHRSLGLVRNARLLGFAEAQEMCLWLRLGVHTLELPADFIEKLNLSFKRLDPVFWAESPEDSPLSQAEQRANYFREIFTQ